MGPEAVGMFTYTLSTTGLLNHANCWLGSPPRSQLHPRPSSSELPQCIHSDDQVYTPSLAAALVLQDYNFTMGHRSGIKHQNTDTLSQHPSPRTVDNSETCTRMELPWLWKPQCEDGWTRRRNTRRECRHLFLLTVKDTPKGAVAWARLMTHLLLAPQVAPFKMKPSRRPWRRG